MATATRQAAAQSDDSERNEVKTPEQWLNPPGPNGVKWVADIQTDAREGMVPFDMPKLKPATAQLVLDFAKALADKLAAAEVKYGYGDSWATPDAEDWPHPKCFTDLVKHLQKGDPRDVAIYCAFLWYHGLSTSKCIEMAGMVPAVELRPTIELLRWMDRRGGLGLDVYNRLRDHIDRLETLLGEKKSQ